MSKTLVLLHTAPSNVSTFAQLLAELDATIPAKHVLDESLLQEARATGITPALRQRIQERLTSEMDEDTAVVLCTCSTIGGVAEETSSPTGQEVIRVDRPMAERAIELGHRILVAAALQSTIAPTTELIQQVAAEQNRDVTIEPLLCEGAWERFEAGDQQGYWQRIADTLRQAVLGNGTGAGATAARVPGVDVIVLAQATMAGAAPLCADLPVPILSSPRLGLEAAIAAYHAVAD
jgi:hypothetical protein